MAFITNQNKDGATTLAKCLVELEQLRLTLVLINDIISVSKFNSGEST